MYRDDSYYEVIVRGVRGWVIKGSKQWEKVQISFALLGNKDPKIRIFTDGTLASGMGDKTPPDSKFTYSMEPEYATNLTTFSQATLDDFVNSQGGNL
ncbi:MAG: hypothetical protein KJ645_14840 [Planctomycetes bacterium]|nr:hypothetical protein [Planctomycetota bacterium]